MGDNQSTPSDDPLTVDDHNTTNLPTPEEVRKHSPTLSIPDNWKPEMMQSIRNKCVSDSARNEMVRVLVNVLFSSSPKPTRQQCNEMAQKLVLKYPSTKDKIGNGYVRQYCYMF